MGQYNSHHASRITHHYDVIVVGLGGMGSAAAYEVAKRGERVLGLERFTPAHTQGSSHGHSRIIRLAYFEDPAYVPLLRRSYDLWRQLERDSGKHILSLTGGIMIGPPSSEVVAGSVRSAREHNLEHEMLDAGDIRRRFPQFTPQSDVVALYETISGVLLPEEAILTYLDLAERHGATLRFEEPVTQWEAAGTGDRVRVSTEQGSYEAERLVIAPGAWATPLLPDLALPIEVERQVVYWFDPAGGIEPFLPGNFPVYIWEDEDSTMIYGFPAQEGPHAGARGAKVGFFGGGAITTPEEIDRTVHPEEIAQMQRHLATHIPAMSSGECTLAMTCMFVNTPDEHFMIDVHPDHPQVAIAAGFCGHGYKFASVVGEIMADLAIEGSTRHPIGLFHPRRFQ